MLHDFLAEGEGELSAASSGEHVYRPSASADVRMSLSSRSMTALRAASVTIPVVITDEFTVKTPKERSPTDQSFVMKNLITQATPQALQDATRGNRSWLKEEFGGYLYAPSQLKRFVRHRHWKDAQQVAEQLTKLDLMTLTPFRRLVRDELRDMISIGIGNTFVRSRRVTMSSHLTGSAYKALANDVRRTNTWANDCAGSIFAD